MNLSVVIVAKNATLHIGACIAAARRVSDDVLLVDTGSEDDTIEISRDMGARVLQREWLGYSETKNMANALAKNDWILSLDSDEILSDELIEAISKIAPDYNKVYKIRRHNYYKGQLIKHCHWNPDWVYRLFDRRTARWEGNFVHEKLAYNNNVDILELDGKIKHFSYENLDHRLNKIKQYAKLSAGAKFQKGKRTNILFQYLATAGKFIATYFIHLGFLDGAAGFEIAWTDAKHIFLRHKHLRRLQQGLNTDCCD